MKTKKQAFILSVDDNPNEENYQMMALLLIKSIIDTNPNCDIYCGIFTDRFPTSVIKEIEKHYPEVNIHINIVFPDTQLNQSNYFLRNYTCWYFADKLLGDQPKYEQLIYIDMDAIVLKKIDFALEPNAVIVEEVPESIKLTEEKYIGVVKHQLFYNWWTIITSSNKYIWDINYEDINLLLGKNSCIEISKRILDNVKKGNLKIIDQTMGAYYPKHELTPESILFHYDGFIDSGSFWRLKEFNKKLFKKYRLYAELIGLINNNDVEYWNK